MASIRKETIIDAAPDAVWDALCDIGALHTRLVPGFVVDTELMPNEDARIVTFANGLVAKEVIVDVDATQRRLAWAAESERIAHHNASMQIFDTGDGRSRAVWIADVLPHTSVEPIGAMMEQGMIAMKACLEGDGQTGER